MNLSGYTTTNDSSPNIGEFTNNDQLINLHRAYFSAYQEQQPTQTPWPAFNDFDMLPATDGAVVHFTTEQPLLKANRQDEGILGNAIADLLINCAGYFLAQGISPDQVPDTLRLSLAICHENIHWTGLVASVGSFKQAYTTLFNQTRHFIDAHHSDLSETARHADAQNAILETFALNNDPSLSPIEKSNHIIAFFNNPSPIHLFHYDSLNSPYYLKRIQESLFFVNHMVEPTLIPCSQQNGNTCGDHTVINLFTASIYQRQAIINEPNYPTSTNLRQLTLQPTTATAKTILETVLQPNNIMTDSTITAAKYQAQLENKLADLITELTALTHHTMVVLMPYAFQNTIDDNIAAINTTLAQYGLTNHKDKIIANLKQLANIFLGEDELFNQLKIAPEDKPIYASLFELMAKDQWSEAKRQLTPEPTPGNPISPPITPRAYQINLTATDKQTFLAQLKAELDNPRCTRTAIVDFFHDLKKPHGKYQFVHKQKHATWDKFRLWFKAIVNPGQDEENFWHTETYQQAVKLLKNAYLNKPDSSPLADDLIDYVRGNAPLHGNTTSTRRRISKK